MKQGGDEGAVAEVAVVRVFHLRLHVHLHLVERGAATDRSMKQMNATVSCYYSISQKNHRKRKRDKKRRTLLKIHGIPGQKGLLFVIILLLLREVNIKLFYSNFLLFKLTVFYNTIQYTFYNTL